MKETAETGGIAPWKTYWTVSSAMEDVISIIAMEAMREVEGFGSISNPLSKDLAELIGKKSAARGVSVLPEEDSVSIDVFISVKYNYSVVQVSQAIQEAIRKSVEDMTGIPVKAVNVHVGSVAFEKGKQA